MSLLEAIIADTEDLKRERAELGDFPPVNMVLEIGDRAADALKKELGGYFDIDASWPHEDEQFNRAEFRRNPELRGYRVYNEH